MRTTHVLEHGKGVQFSLAQEEVSLFHKAWQQHLMLRFFGGLGVIANSFDGTVHGVRRKSNDSYSEPCVKLADRFSACVLSSRISENIGALMDSKGIYRDRGSTFVVNFGSLETHFYFLGGYAQLQTTASKLQ